MVDHHKTVKESRQYWLQYLLPNSNKIHHRLESVNDLPALSRDYDLFLLDADSTLLGHLEKEKDKRFEIALIDISKKAEIVSNCSIDRFFELGEIFSREGPGSIPVNRLAHFTSEEDYLHLMRFEEGQLKIYKYDVANTDFIDQTSRHWDAGSRKLNDILYTCRKPDPMVIHSVVDMNLYLKKICHGAYTEGDKIKKLPRVLMVGDRHWTDIVCGNLADVDTARVKPHRLECERKYGVGLRAVRYLDSGIGWVTSHLAVKR